MVLVHSAQFLVADVHTLDLSCAKYWLQMPRKSCSTVSFKSTAIWFQSFFFAFRLCRQEPWFDNLTRFGPRTQSPSQEYMFRPWKKSLCYRRPSCLTFSGLWGPLNTPTQHCVMAQPLVWKQRFALRFHCVIWISTMSRRLSSRLYFSLCVNRRLYFSLALLHWSKRSIEGSN